MSELMSIIKDKADTDAVYYIPMDLRPVTDGLITGINGQNHINGIENFWGLCKVRLAKFRGVHKHTFYLHIKECEFRYNYRNKNIYLTLLRKLRKMPIKLY